MLPEWMWFEDALRHVRALTSSDTERAAAELAHLAALGRLHCKSDFVTTEIRLPSGDLGPPSRREKRGEKIPPEAWVDPSTMWRGGYGQVELRVGPENPCGDLVPGVYSFGCIWFRRSEVLAHYPISTDPPVTPNAATTSRAGGVPAKFNWDIVTAEVIRRIHEDGIPSSVRAFASEMLDWCNDHFPESEVPSESAMRSRLSKWLRPVKREAG